MRQLFEAAVSWSYDSPAKGGLHRAHYPGRVANRIVLLKWTSRAAALVFAIMLCGSNSARAAASQSQIPCADGLSRQRIHVTLRKPTKPREEIAMMQPTPNESRIHTDELVDIREVTVDKNLPKEESPDDVPGRTGGRLYPPDQKSLPLPLRRFRGKRLLCRERRYVGGMSARHFALSDILAFFRRECYDRCGKG